MINTIYKEVLMTTITYNSIGYVTSPHKSRVGSPIQPTGAKQYSGKIIINKELQEGLLDLDGFSHIIVLYHLHKVDQCSLICKPFMDDQRHGIFAIRGPNRPNPIGLSVLPILGIQGNEIEVGHLDILDATPVLDIKPYVTDFDSIPHATKGWLENNVHKSRTMVSDTRFIK